MLRWLLVAVLLLGAALPASAITGVCPDGSIFIVGRRSQIPCEDAKEVESSKVPPLRPHHLPRPYEWEVYREQADTRRNPYHLIERGEEVRRGSAPIGGEQGTGTAGNPPPRPPVPQVAARNPVAAPQTNFGNLGLNDGEIRDLFFVVELSQREAPATFVEETASGREGVRVSFAHSEAFAERAERVTLVQRGDRRAVLLFSVVAAEGGAFHPNFTFVQGHQAYRPDRTDGRQLGLVKGEAGPLAANDTLLGYVVLPADIDLGRPVDLYWNDRRLEARFR